MLTKPPLLAKIVFCLNAEHFFEMLPSSPSLPTFSFHRGVPEKTNTEMLASIASICDAGKPSKKQKYKNVISLANLWIWELLRQRNTEMSRKIASRCDARIPEKADTKMSASLPSVSRAGFRANFVRNQIWSS